MPGYDTEGVVFKQPELLTKYTCPECNLLLLDAVQPSCGHWLCQSCADLIIQRGNDPCCPRKNCSEPFTSEDDSKLYFPDRFVRKDIERLLISCKFCHEGCNWNGRFGTLKEHLQVCNYSTTQCKWCQKSIQYNDLEFHESTCSCAEHLNSDEDKYLANCFLGFTAAPREQRCENTWDKGYLRGDGGLLCPLASIGCTTGKFETMQDLGAHMRDSEIVHQDLLVARITRLETNGIADRLHQCTDSCNSGIKSQFSAINLCFSSLSMAQELGQASSSMSNLPMTSGVEAQLQELKREVETVRKELRNKDEMIASLRTVINKLEYSKNTEFEDQDFRLSLIENSNYDGTMVWKIPQFSQRMTDAQSGKYTSIFSLPFYTGRYGYKMCLRLYILGDGIGKGSYMSLFFVLMKGEFDNILQWPFTHKVTFKLLNQGNGRDIVDTFQPDPMSTSFRKPKSDMNIASGCPCFVSHEDLKSGSFILNDTVVVSCIVKLPQCQ